MSSLSLISVIYVARPGDRRLRETELSPLNSQHRAIELLCVGLAAQDAPNDERVRVLPRVSDNRAANLNAAVAASQGEFLIGFQAGDEWEPDKLTRQLHAFEEHPNAAVVWSRVGGEGFHPSQNPRLRESLGDRLRLYPVWETPSNPLIRREALEAVGGFNEDCPQLSNWELWRRLIGQFEAVGLSACLVRSTPPPLSREDWNRLRDGLQPLHHRLQSDDPPEFQSKLRHNLSKWLLAEALRSSDRQQLRDAVFPLLRSLLENDVSLRPEAELGVETYRQLVSERFDEPLSQRWLAQLQLEPVPPISVVIPAYNSEATIGETLRSLLAQTFTDFEIIVVDDASSDRTLEVVRSFEDPRLQVIESPQNQGPAISRNIGAKQARGRYLSFIDADDLWTPGKLQSQYEALEANPDTAVAYSWTDYIDEAGNWLRSGSYLNLQAPAVASLGLDADTPLGVDALSHLLLGDFLENGSNALIRRDAFESVGGFDPEFVVAHDWDLFLRLAARYFFLCIPRSQIRYRLSGSSVSSNVARQEHYCRRALDRAYETAPQALQSLRSRSLTNLYHYLTYRALQPGASAAEPPALDAEKCRLALGFLDKIAEFDPRVDDYRPLLNELRTLCHLYIEQSPEVAARLCKEAGLSGNPQALFQHTKSRPYPAISVIIPAYNAEDSIRETLESVLAQTFTDFEIIVIDDGSSDRTVEVVKRIEDDRLQVYAYPNAGQGESRNRGVCHASGEFFAFLDSDDLWTPDKLEAQYRALVEWEAPSSANYVGNSRPPAVAYSWVDWIDVSGKFLQRGCDYTQNGYVYRQLLLSDFIAGGSNLMMWRGAFYQVGGFNPDFPPAEDRDMWLRLSEKFHFVAVEKPQLLYRQVPTSQSANVVRMERSQRRVLEAAFQRAPEVAPFNEPFYTREPQRLAAHRRQTYANSYKYLTFKALDGDPDPKQGRLAMRLFATVLENEPQLWKERRFVLKLWLRILATAYLRPQWTQWILQRFPTFPKLHSELLRYTKMEVEL